MVLKCMVHRFGIRLSRSGTWRFTLAAHAQTPAIRGQANGLDWRRVKREWQPRSHAVLHHGLRGKSRSARTDATWPIGELSSTRIDGGTQVQVCGPLASAQLLNSGHVVPLEARANSQFRAGEGWCVFRRKVHRTPQHCRKKSCLTQRSMISNKHVGERESSRD